MKIASFLTTINLICTILLCSCQEKYINKLNYSDEGLCVITNWLLIGPFDFDTTIQVPYETFFNKDLEKYGVNESQFKNDDFTRLEKADVPTNLLSRKYSTHHLKYMTDSNIETKSNFYLATKVISKHDTLVYALIDGSGAYKIWVNSHEIYQERFRKNQSMLCDRFIPLRLQKGENIIFAKVNREANVNAWGLDFAISPLPKAVEIYQANYFENFIYTPVFTDSIIFYSGPLTPGKALIKNDDTVAYFPTSIDSNGNHFVSGLNEFPDGFYSFSFCDEDITMEQSVFKGDTHEYYNSLISMKPMIKDTLEYKEYKGLTDRIDFLFENYDDRGLSAIKYYDTNLVHWIDRLQTFLKDRKRQAERLTLKAYSNQESKTIAHYGFMCDSTLNNHTEIPLIVVMPYSIPQEYFPISWYIGNNAQLFIDCKLATQRGFAICFLYGGGEKYNIDSLKEEFTGVLNNIKTHFPNVKTDKVFLTGICKGASKSLELAIELPERIEALALHTPLEDALSLTELSNLRNMRQ